MPLLSISEAARLTGADRKTIRRQIERGILSATRGPDGRRGVDPAELARVYPDLNVPGASPAPSGKSPQDSPGDARPRSQGLDGEVVAILREQLEEAREREAWLREQLEQAQGEVSKVRAENEGLRDQVRLLEGPRGELERQSWWARLLGK